MSKEMRVMRAIGDIDDIYIDEAAPVQKKRAIQLNSWIKYVGMAAAAVLVVGIGIFAMTRNNIGVDTPAQTAVTEPEPVVTEDTGNLVSLGNPYVYYDTIEEAVKAAGFEMSVPESFGKYIDRHIATIADDMIEVTYYDEAGNKGFSIRKTAGTNDPSGDYNIYDNSVTADIGGKTVTMAGNGDAIFKAVWAHEGYAYSVSSCENGLSQADAEEIIKKVK